jgi:hypothetical protein
MSSKNKLVPGPDIEFDQFFEHYCEVAVENTSGTTPVWPHIPKTEALTLRSDYIFWHEAYLKLQGPHTSGDVLAKQELRAAAEKDLRAFNREYILFSRKVTDAQRKDLGCPVHDTHPTHIGTPKTVPLLTSLRTMSGHAVEIRFQDETTPDSTALPYGTNGCLLNYAWGPEKIEDLALLKETALMTHTPFTLALPPEAEGATLSCYIRWQNETGHLGKPGEVHHIVVT